MAFVTSNPDTIMYEPCVVVSSSPPFLFICNHRLAHGSPQVRRLWLDSSLWSSGGPRITKSQGLLPRTSTSFKTFLIQVSKKRVYKQLWGSISLSKYKPYQLITRGPWPATREPEPYTPNSSPYNIVQVIQTKNRPPMERNNQTTYCIQHNH